MKEEYTPTQQEENEIDYLAEILVEAYLESKGYKAKPWLYGETKWEKIKKESDTEV